MPDPSSLPIQILLVEDNLVDARLTQESLNDRAVVHDLYTVRDGVDAIDFLSRRGNCQSMPQPDLILLDLSLPRKDGLEVLAFIKNNATLKGIPVVILTSSLAERDIARSYDLHCNCYINKPVDLATFSEVVRAIGGFWCSIAELHRAGTAVRLGQV